MAKSQVKNIHFLWRIFNRMQAEALQSYGKTVPSKGVLTFGYFGKVYAIFFYLFFICVMTQLSAFQGGLCPWCSKELWCFCTW